MGSVGLLYVGAVLAVNGLMLMGRVDPRAAAPLNLFVGVLQVVPRVALRTPVVVDDHLSDHHVLVVHPHGLEEPVRSLGVADVVDAPLYSMRPPEGGGGY